MLYFIRKIRQYGAFRAFQIGIARVIKNAVWIAHLGSFWVKLFLGRRHCYAFHDIAWRLPQGWAGGYAASEQSRSCALMNMDHRFDLLGSGWVGWNRSKNGVGLCLGNNDDLQLSLRSIPLLFRSSAKTLSEICGNNYSPINWCHDPIKNYTWSTGKVYLSQPTRSMLGADLKMPWEISRFNHLPMMATVAVTSTDDDEADRLASEIVAQIAESGLFLLKSDRIYVCLVARKYEEGINYGHTHNDNLSINILVDGFPILFDPGTFCYTNDVIKRNEFRSSRIHNFPFLGIEQNPIIADSRYAFHLKPASSFSAGVSNFSIIACGAFSGIKCGRKVEIGENEIIISDFATKAIDESLAMPHVFSNAYGHLKVVRESYIPNWTMETNFHV